MPFLNMERARPLGAEPTGQVIMQPSAGMAPMSAEERRRREMLAEIEERQSAIGHMRKRIAEALGSLKESR